MIAALISSITGLKVGYVERLAQTANHRYKSYLIPKRTGGVRKIDHPSRQLKFLQRWLADNLFSRLPVHEAAYSYKKDLGIKDHAEIHQRSKYILRVDFRNFFPSIRGDDVRRVLMRNRSLLPIQISDEDLSLISLLVCKDDKLTIGAPSSPSISNAIMFDFDSQLFSSCKQGRITYSRYADDLYFSTDRSNVLRPLLGRIETYLQSMLSPRLDINDAKTEFVSKKRKCVVTGLVLTSNRKISIGREKKRAIKSMVFRFQRGTLEAERQKYLKGYLAFIISVEPSFFEALRIKFGSNVLQQILQNS